MEACEFNGQPQLPSGMGGAGYGETFILHITSVLLELLYQSMHFTVCVIIKLKHRENWMPK